MEAVAQCEGFCEDLQHSFGLFAVASAGRQAAEPGKAVPAPLRSAQTFEVGQRSPYRALCFRTVAPVDESERVNRHQVREVAMRRFQRLARRDEQASIRAQAEL